MIITNLTSNTYYIGSQRLDANPATVTVTDSQYNNDDTLANQINGLYAARNVSLASPTSGLPRTTSRRGADGSLGTTITESELELTDLTTADVSTTKHGLVPKATNTGTKFLRDDATWATPAGSSIPYVNIRNVQTAGTDGGEATAGSWQKVTMNTEASDADAVASISSSQITLSAGTYICKIRVPLNTTNQSACRLYNATGAAVVIQGSSTNAATQTDAWITGKFTIAAAQALEVQTLVRTTASNGWGAQTNSWVTGGVPSEIYAEAEFWKIA